MILNTFDGAMSFFINFLSIVSYPERILPFLLNVICIFYSNFKETHPLMNGKFSSTNIWCSLDVHMMFIWCLSNVHLFDICPIFIKKGLPLIVVRRKQGGSSWQVLGHKLFSSPMKLDMAWASHLTSPIL